MDWLDGVVIIGYLAVVTAWGIRTGRGQTNLEEYLLAGRNLPWWLLLGSIVATETSTVTFLSIPGLSYKPGGDLRFLQLAMGYIVGRFAVARFLLPLYFQGKLSTAYQALERQFGAHTKTVTALLFLMMRNLADGLRLYLAAIVVATATDWSLFHAVLIVGIVTAVYTLYGGLRSVVWNDCLQLVVYVVGAVVAFGVIVRRLPGGWTHLVEYANQYHKLTVFHLHWNTGEPYTLWAGLIGGAFLSLATHGADQMMVQRYLCARTQADAARAVISSGVVVFLQFALFLWLGVALAAFYHDYHPGQPPFPGDQVLTRFVIDELPAGLRGLLLAAVFAAAMSTLSSSLNASVATTSEDLLRPWGVFRRLQERAQLACGRAMTIGFATLQVVVALLAPLFTQQIIDHVLAIAGFTTGVVLGLFLLALTRQTCRSSAVLCGLATSLTVMSFIAFATPIAWPWYSAIGALTTVVCSYLFHRLLSSS